MEKPATAAFFVSPQQKHLCLAQDRHATICLAQSAILIQGPLDRRSLHESLRKVVARHEILRTAFRRQTGMKVPFQVVLDPDQCEPSWETRDLNSSVHPPDLRSNAGNLLAEQAELGFDLDQGPVLRALVTTLTPSEHLLLLTLPALCCDFHTLLSLVTEIGAGYSDQNPAADSLRYVQFSQWQNDVLESEDDSTKEGREFWKRQQTLEETPFALPFEQDPAPGTAFQPARFAFSISHELLNQIEESSRRFGVPASTFLLACWECLLYRISGRASFPISVIFDGREYEELRDALGLIAKALPLSCRVEEDFRFDELLRHLQPTLSRAASWQEYFAPAGESLDAVSFEYQTLPPKQVFRNTSFTVLGSDSAIEPFKLRLSCRAGTGLEFTLHYDSARLSPDAIRRLAEEFEVLLRAATTNPGELISRLPLLSENAKQEILFDWNATEAPYPQQCIHELFAAQAEHTPDRLAVVTEQQSLTYRELNQESNRLAHHLQRLGVGPDSLVGLCVDRSARMMTAVMAILKAGGAYLPVSADHPKPRLARQLARASVLVTERQFATHMPDFAGPVLCLDSAPAPWISEPATNPEANASPDNIAYVLHTSGSTGVPKGVAVRHRNLVNYTWFIRELLDLKAHPEGLQFATVSTLGADLGNTCIFPALLSGGTLHVLSYEIATDSQRMTAYQELRPIDVLKIVPSHLAALLNSPEGGKVLPKRYLILGGETLSRGLMEKIEQKTPACQIVNHYGPTESTVGSLTLKLAEYDWRHSPAASIPIGRPIAGTRVYILDSHRRPLPIGVAGELYIAGAGVTAGYLDQPDQTAEKFVPDPFVSSDRPSSMYRTGDLARYLPDGNVEFLGRGDDQVKVRGFRIELGEIEAVLSRYPGVRQTVVLARQHEGGDRQLVAYVVVNRENVLRQQQLRDFVKEQLPDYMVPSAIVMMEKLPLTANGKVDRKALPAPEQAETSRIYAPPQTQTEEIVAAIWNEVLGGQPIGIDDNFFELGGHSLMATQIISRLRERFSVELALRAMFETPTIRGLAMTADVAKRDATEVETIVPLSRDAYRRAPAGRR